jgi:hypothetical protein
MVIVKMLGLTKRYDSTLAVDHLNLEEIEGVVEKWVLVARGRTSGNSGAFRTPVGGSKALYAFVGLTVHYTTGLQILENLRELCNLLFFGCMNKYRKLLHQMKDLQ